MLGMPVLIVALIGSSLPLLYSEESSHAQSFQQKKMPAYMKGKRRLRVMTFNVENLFDTKHDTGKLDFAYLPRKVKDKSDKIKRMCHKMGYGKKKCLYLDWNRKKLKRKMHNLAKAVIANGYPDIIILQEVENRSVLKELRDKYLPKYIEVVLVEGDDRRGVDVAMLSKLPLVRPPQAHTIPFRPQKDTRPILEAHFRLPDKKVIRVFAFHFPSLFLETRYRAISINYLRKVMSRDDHNLIIAGGDSNVKKSEENLWQKYAKGFVVTNQLGVRGNGSHFYKGKWNLFDVIVFKDTMVSGKASNIAGWRYRNNSARVANAYRKQYKYNKKGQKIPRAFRYPKFNGVSDHFPVMVTLEKVRQ